jgi:TfoX/Sxy family transcriptional regulator of competence genes
MALFKIQNLNSNNLKMPSDQNFVDSLVAQMDISGQIAAKKMFGEYGLYFDGKLFALVCDNKLYIKPTQSGKEFIGDVVEKSPYSGAKPSFLIEDKLEDRNWLAQLVHATVKELPAPKPKKKK